MSSPSPFITLLRGPAAILALLAVLWFVTLGTRHLLEPDEGRYAEISREMLTTGDWVTPRLNGLKYFEKPPLQYWATAVAFKVFGYTEFAARLWLGLCGFGGIALAWFTGTRLFGRPAGMLAATILCSSLMYAVIGHLNTLDMGLSFWFEVILCGFMLAQHAPTDSRGERHYMWLAWIAAALAFLTKGLIAFILPGLCLLLYTAVCREYSAWRRLHVWSGGALLLVVCMPWIVLAALRNPEFLRFFFWHEQFERFLMDSHDRDGPWWYFLPLLLIGALPWTLVALRQSTNSWHADAGATGFQVRRFMWLWVFTVIGFFSLSHSKLPPYIVPVLPMLALLLGERLATLPARILQNHWWIMGSLLLCTGLGVALLPDTVAGTNSIELVRDLRPETAISIAAAGLTLLFTAWRIQFRQCSIEQAGLCTGLGVTLALTVLIQGSNGLDLTRSGYAVALQVKPFVQANTRLYSVDMYPQSLPFYLGRTLTLVHYRGELDFGLTQQPELGIDDFAGFETAWREPGPAIAVMSPDLYAEFAQHHLPMQVIAKQPIRQPKWLAVQKPE
jgi:4-amino-4-deoxy-L-arabinose transferase-like glycosyltransferase